MTENSEPQPSYEILLAELRDIRSRISRLEETVAQIQSPKSREVTPPPLQSALLKKSEPVKIEAVESGPKPKAVLPWVPISPAEPVPEKHPSTAPAASAADARTLEEIIGTRWMLFVGVGVLLLSAVFFFKYAIDKGWINAQIRLIAGAIGGLVMIGFGEWALRRGMRLFAGAISGAGIVLLYLVIFVASPNGLYSDLQLLGSTSTVAFILMCVVTVIGIGVSIRNGTEATAVISLIGALATPILLSSGQNRQVVLMVYLLIVDAAFLSLALFKSWRTLSPIALAGTAMLFFGWCTEYYIGDDTAQTVVFAWMFYAMFAAYGSVGALIGRAEKWTAMSVTMISGLLLMSLLAGVQLVDGVFFLQLFVLYSSILAIWLWRRWSFMRIAALVWAAGILFLRGASKFTAMDSPVAWSLWVWVFFSLITADVLIRAWWKQFKSIEFLDAWCSTVAMACLFASTYHLLGVNFQSWMGSYAAVLGAGAIAMAWIVRTGAGKIKLAYSYLGQGLVLITLAVPIQFDFAAVTIAWAVMGVVLLYIARRLESKWLFVNSIVVLFLALVHYVSIALPGDPNFARVLFSLGGADIKLSLITAAILSACLLAAGGVMRIGKALLPRDNEVMCAAAFVAIAVVLFNIRTAIELPAIVATWWWLIPAAGIAAFAIVRRSDWLAMIGAVTILACSAKWLLYDTLDQRMRFGADMSCAVVLNGQFIAGVLMAITVLAFAYFLHKRDIFIISDSVRIDRGLIVLFILLAPIMVVWGGSFEIDRFFYGLSQGQWENPAQARHMVFSMWWAFCATVIIAIGFLTACSLLRYLALAIFAVTIGKVFLVDMRKVETIYRILSFLCLGLTLLGGAFLYHRVFLVKKLESDPLSEKNLQG